MTADREDSPLSLELEGGGSAEVVSSDGSQVELRASRAFPPGSTLALRTAGEPRAVRVKVRGSKRLAGGGDRPFRVDGRFVDLTRAQRKALLPALVTDDAKEPSGPGDDGER